MFNVVLSSFYANPYNLPSENSENSATGMEIVFSSCEPIEKFMGLKNIVIISRLYTSAAAGFQNSLTEEFM